MKDSGADKNKNLSEVLNFSTDEVSISDFDRDCLLIYGRVLNGEKKHWCVDYDRIPIDESVSDLKKCKCYESSDRLNTIDDEIIIIDTD